MGAVAIGIMLGILLDLQRQNNILIYEARAEEVEEIEKVVQIEVKIDWSKKERIVEEIQKASKKYGVSYEKMYNTVKCESDFNYKIQSQHILSYGQEQSWGVAQWHLPAKNRNADGVVITKEMALDPAQALDAMAYHFSIGNAKAWTCFRKLYL